MAKTSKKQLAAVDLFCGVGGLTHGLKLAGIPVLAGFDIEKSCKYAYEKNNGATFVDVDIREIDDKKLLSYFPINSEKIMVGCAPCQTFSTHTQKVASRDQDKKWGLITEYLKKILIVQPTIVSMENVPGICKYEIFDQFVQGLKDNGYFVSFSIVYCPDYGIAQSRRRLVLLASKYGAIEMIAPTHLKTEYLTVKDIIGELPELKDGGEDPNDRLHRCSSLTSINMKRMLASKPGGTWLDWPKELRSKCHEKDSGNTYKSVYARMKWTSLAPTITTQFNNFGTGRFGHPEQNRALSIREGALIQTFPKSYEFFSAEASIDFKKACRMIGNAVPVRLGEVIGLSIKTHLDQYLK
jgi:DNA (cytosine-5)-methyltransferase 1